MATSKCPLGVTCVSEPPSRSHALASRDGSKRLPKEHNGDDPLISSGVDQVTAWSVDIDPKIAFEQNCSVPSGGAPQDGLNLNTDQVTYTLSTPLLLRKVSAATTSLS